VAVSGRTQGDPRAAPLNIRRGERLAQPVTGVLKAPVRDTGTVPAERLPLTSRAPAGTPGPTGGGSADAREDDPVRRPALLVRFPSLRTRPQSWPVVLPDAAAAYPTLADDLALLESVVGPEFQRSDRDALAHQNRYRRQQVAILSGSALVTGLGGLQAAVPGSSWPGVVLLVLGALVTWLSSVSGELRTFDDFLGERVKAERLRAMYFRYLSRTGRYAGDDRERALRRAVVAVRNGEEPT